MKTFLKTISLTLMIIIFVSCSNDITKIGGGIDSKYEGKYSGAINRKDKNGIIEMGELHSQLIMMVL
ncbi:hypothetical protein [Brachyspira intermedia]|uniref:hypothetical protein n=1 Tax=Brachyspira intermedia TaxID=84377 RepID=UPI003006C5FB